jgi:hypothetical protein
MRTKLILAAFVALFGLGVAAIAQTPFNPTIPTPKVVSIGQNDLVNIIPNGSPSAQSIFGNAGWVGGLEQYSLQVPLTAFTITIPAHTSLMMINPAGTLATGTFTMEANPSDGQRACLVSTQTQTAITISAPTGQTIGGLAVPAGMTANTRICFTYIALTATWYHYAMN